MCPSTKAKILTMLPIVQVMARAPARHGVIGDLIMQVASSGQHLVGTLEHRHLCLFVRQGELAALLSPIEWRALFDGQAIPRNMRRGEGDSLVEAPLPGG